MSIDYESRKARIVQCDTRSRAWKTRALRKLKEDLGAREVRRDGKPVALETETGRMLCRKKSFRNLEAAESALAQVNLFTTEAEKRPCRAYHCVYCGRFHLTSVSGSSRSEPESD